MSVQATVVVPTTKDRGLLLPYSVGSILQQSLKDIEVFIIGDGVYEETRQTIHAMMEKDPRIRFFDHPKHTRRGEEYRHQALQEAKGHFITYMNDRDLLLPHHLETLASYFAHGNLVTSLHFYVHENHLSYGVKKPNLKAEGAMVFSTIAHTLELYRSLPYGWRTTPPKYPTDWYMWQQVLSHPDCEPYSGFAATMLYFKRGNHPGLSTPERQKELIKWHKIVYETKELGPYQEAALEELLREKHYLQFQKILIKGGPIQEVPSRIFKKFTSLLKR